MFDLLNFLGEFIIITEYNGTINYCNNSASSIFDIREKDNIKKIFKKDDRDVFLKNLVHLVKKYGSYSNFMRFVKKDNDLIFCWLNAFKYENRIVFEVFDLTKMKNRDMSINDENYTKLLKYMSEGVAHSIRNPIMSAGGMLNLIKRKLPKDTAGSILSYIDVVEKSLYRIMNIIADIEIVSSSVPSVLRKVNLNSIVKNVVNKYKYDITFNIEEHDTIEIFAEDTHISFVFEEIIKNSLDSLQNKEDGLIEITLKRINNNAIVTIIDNGEGIEENDLPLVSIPFYSTKPSNMGIGLSLSKFIIEGYNGTIDIQSKKGEGVRVVISLPIEKRNLLRREIKNV